MLLLSLSEGAGSGMVEVVSPTKAEGLEVPGNRKESDFSCFYQDSSSVVSLVPFAFAGGCFLFKLFPYYSRFCQS